MLSKAKPLFSLRTQNYSAMYRFYTEILGEPSSERPGCWAQYKDQHLYLWATRTKSTAGNSLQLCLAVDDLEAARASLPQSSEPSPTQTADHGKELFFWDPDGNQLILYQPQEPTN